MLGAAALSVATAAGAAQEEFTNAELVSIDPSTRMLVVRNNTGAEETLKLDDAVAGLDGLKSGDRVILTVRGEPGLRRVSAVRKSTAEATAPTDAKTPASVVTGAAAENPGLAAFAEQVAEVSRRAVAVDTAWMQFRSTCSPTVEGTYDSGREWFGVWENRVRADLSIGSCRDLYNQILDRGEGVKTAMAAAEESARQAAVRPGDMRSARRKYSLDWEGWGLPAPDRQQP
jgi:hypothetical protein